MTQRISTNYSEAWYNFVTNEDNYLNGPPSTDEQAVQYLPQPYGANLYRVLRQHENMGILEAMARVLLVATGSEDNCDCSR